MTQSSSSPLPGQRYDKDYTYELYDQAYYQSVCRNEQYLSHRWRLRWIDACLCPQPGDRIVDLGCGAGLVAKHCASRGAIVHGVDLAEEAIKVCRATNRDYPQNTFVRGDASRCDHLPSESFDKACSIDVTEHCGHDVMCDIFAEAYRLLKPGGLYMVYTPNPRHWIEVARRLHLQPQKPEHTGLRPAEVIVDALRSRGFELHRQIKPPSMIPVVQWLERLWSMQPIFPELGVYRVVVVGRKPGRAA